MYIFVLVSSLFVCLFALVCLFLLPVLCIIDNQHEWWRNWP